LQGNFVLNANSLVFDTSPIPEPAEWGLGAGLLALLAAWRRRRATKPLAGPPVSSSADPDCS
jgi:MYXO-CTERM domain-containing protein